MDTFVIVTPAEIDHEEYGTIQVEIIHTYRAEDVKELAIEKMNNEWEHENFYSERYGYLDEHDVNRVIRRDEFEVFHLEDEEEVELSDDELETFYKTLEEDED